MKPITSSSISSGAVYRRSVRAVGSTTSKVGSVVDLAGVEHQALSRYTPDAGNHVSVSVHPAAALSFP